MIVSGLAFSVHVGNEEDDGEHDAEGADDDVADGEEVVLAAEQVGRRDHEVLVPAEVAHVVVILDLDFVVPWHKIAVNFAVELAEIGKPGSPHPHDEVL